MNNSINSVNFYQEVELEEDPEEAGICHLEEILHSSLGEVATEQAQIRLIQNQKIQQHRKVNLTKCYNVRTDVCSNLFQK